VPPDIDQWSERHIALNSPNACNSNEGCLTRKLDHPLIESMALEVFGM